MDLAAGDGGQIAAAWVAVGGTLLGALAVGLLQGWQASKQRASQEREGRAQREEAAAALARQMLEARLHWLRSERRALYARVLDLADEWSRALQDLRDSKLPDADVKTTAEARAAMPLAADNLDMMGRMTRMVAEVTLLADSDVRAAVDGLHSALRKAFAMAVKGQNGLPAVTAHRAETIAAMRRELVQG